MKIIIPMAGLGKRFMDRHEVPKPLIKIRGKTMIQRVVENFGDLNSYIFIILKEHEDKFQLSKHLESICMEKTIVITDKVTNGPAESCLLAEKYLGDEPLVIVNCDQIIEDFSWDSFNNFVQSNNPDAVLGVFHSNSPKNSYVKLDENLSISGVKEKIVISNIATNGFHYWLQAKDFVESAKEMINAGERYCGEVYIGPSFNYLISKGKKVLPYYFNSHFPIGIIDDLDGYVDKLIVRYKKTDIYGLDSIARSEVPNLSNDDDFPSIFVGDFAPPREVSPENYEVVRSIMLNAKNIKGILEIGVNRPENGELSFTKTFLEDKPRESIYLGVDVLDKSYLNSPEHNIHTIQASSFEQTAVREKMKSIGMDKISILMIDGWHSINAVINDWKYADLLTDDGVVIFHDTNFHPGPRFFLKGINKKMFQVEKYCQSRYDWGVSVARRI